MAYSPATALSTGTLPAAQATFYNKTAVEALYANLAFQTLVTPLQVPMNSGKTIQIFAYDTAPFTSGVVAGAAPTAATEGTVGTGLTPTQSNRTATLAQYVDFVTVSDFAKNVAIDPMLENLAKVLGYRAGLVCDTLVQMGFDAGVAIDATANKDLAADTYLKASDVRAQVASLTGRNGRAFPGGVYRGVIHPFVAGDLFNDATANGLTDILKYTDGGVELLQNTNMSDGNGYRVVRFAGVDFVQSTNVPLTANAFGAGKSPYSLYIAAQDALFGIGLGDTALPGQKNFKLIVKEFSNGSGGVADPASVIGGAVAYNMKYVVAARPGTTMVFKRIRCQSNIS